ncbi:MAG: CDP-diacylglycerol--glycerol-3-phosphate 3-phosphatidyltransferase [Deltaproteobacteria bacterium]|nr:CDP-diacylglycerol--glycerol-3-phosphate 3-phosphatidyltransferase [Deltaproteobacteria bacterium]
MAEKARIVWTPANIVSAARIAMFPFMIVLAYLELAFPSENVRRHLTFWYALLFTLGMLSDVLDGYLARSRNEVTTLGKFLDPLSDKILVVTALLLLVMHGRAPAWVAIVIILREVTVTALRTMASAEGVIITARWWGKLKTLFQSFALGFLLLHYPRNLFGVVFDFHFWGTVLLYAALVITVWSGYEYFHAFFLRDDAPPRDVT